MIAMKASIFVGDIADADADALCTSTNPHLSLVMGTGAAVRARGGFEILRACEAIVAEQGLLPAGSVHRTTAGSLPHQGIIHCVASDDRHHSSDAIIASCVTGSLRIAAEAGWKSIAMPLFATGHARVKITRSIEVMARTASESGAAVERLLFVIHDRDHAEPARTLLRSIFGGDVPIVRSTAPIRSASSWFSDDDPFG